MKLAVLLKRSVQVVPPEEEKGSIEYKRKVHVSVNHLCNNKNNSKSSDDEDDDDQDGDKKINSNQRTDPSATTTSVEKKNSINNNGNNGTGCRRRGSSLGGSSNRLMSLASQMSYRLDEGRGTCTYRVGVEDNGYHSLQDVESVRESSRILECIARSLNAVLVRRSIIQNEIQQGQQDENSNDDEKKEGDQHQLDRVVRLPEESVVVRNESPLLGGEHDTVRESLERLLRDGQQAAATGTGTNNSGYARAELTFRRVETHLLDPDPIPLVELVRRTENIRVSGSGVNNDADGSSDGATASSTSTQNGNGPEDPSAKKNVKPAAGSSKKIIKKDGGDGTIEETLSSRNVRVAVVGNVDAGKSTLIGTLTTSCLDDGRGSSRTSIMKHRHEIVSGRTSTVSTHLMGFDTTGRPITSDRSRGGAKSTFRNHHNNHHHHNRRKTEDEVARESFRIVSLMDLAGHEKYLKTTIHGVSSGFSDYSLILVNSRHPPTHMTQHHMNLCCSFGIPIIIVYTKIDGCPDHAYETCKKEVRQMLRSPEVNKRPFMVRNDSDLAAVADKLHAIAPMIETSCVTGSGIDLLQKILFALPKRRRHENKVNRKFEFLIEDMFLNVPGVGAVVSGFVNSGELYLGGGGGGSAGGAASPSSAAASGAGGGTSSSTYVYVGPMDDGSYIKTVAKSAHIARINTSHITSGQSACIALSLNKDTRKKLRRGMVVLKPEEHGKENKSGDGSSGKNVAAADFPTSTRQFDAEICVLKGEGTTIRTSYQAYVHILNVRQSAVARSIEIINHNGAKLPKNYVAVHQQHKSSNGNTTTSIKKKNDNSITTIISNGNDEDGVDDCIVLRPGSRAKVRFEFSRRPEYVRPGMRMLFRDGRVRGVGIITGVPCTKPAPIVVK